MNSISRLVYAFIAIFFLFTATSQAQELSAAELSKNLVDEASSSQLSAYYISYKTETDELFVSDEKEFNSEGALFKNLPTTTGFTDIGFVYLEMDTDYIFVDHLHFDHYHAIPYTFVSSKIDTPDFLLDNSSLSNAYRYVELSSLFGSEALKTYLVIKKK
jgi:hypothetical protein